MQRMVYLICLMFLTLAAGFTPASAEEVLPPKLQQLTDEAYRCYSARETDSYFEVVKKVKDATEFSPYQETYYRACSYEATAPSKTSSAVPSPTTTSPRCASR